MFKLVLMSCSDFHVFSIFLLIFCCGIGFVLKVLRSFVIIQQKPTPQSTYLLCYIYVLA